MTSERYFNIKCTILVIYRLKPMTTDRFNIPIWILTAQVCNNHITVLKCDNKAERNEIKIRNILRG